jgi:RNA polymerase sigma-70 factor, ECF subfamily
MCSHPDTAPHEQRCGLRPDALAVFTTLYHQQAAAVYRYFYHQVAHTQDAEDLTATTFTRALDRLAGYQPEKASLSAWLFGVAHNCMREFRHRRRSMDQLPLDILDAQPEPESQLLMTERAEALHRAIRDLSADQRDALALRFFGELRTGEIATVLDKTDGAVKMLVHRAVKNLRDCATREGWQ